MEELDKKLELFTTEYGQVSINQKAIRKEYEKRQAYTTGLAVKILSILGGFVAVLAFTGFLIMAGLSDSPWGMIIFGTAMIVAAVLLGFQYDKLIVDSTSLCIYVMGLVLFGTGLGLMEFSTTIIFMSILGIAILVMVIIQTYLLSFLSTLAISISVLVIVFYNDAYIFIHVYLAGIALLLLYLFLNEATLISKNSEVGRLYSPVRIGLLFSLLLGLITTGARNIIPESQNHIWITSLVFIPGLLYLISRINMVLEVKSQKSKILIFSIGFVILLATLFSPSISGALLILLLSFFVNYKTGIVLGILALIYFVGQYYYDLNFSLLIKSIILFGSGALFLLLYLFLLKKNKIQ